MPAKRTAEEIKFDKTVSDRLKTLLERNGESVSSAARRAKIPVASLDNWVNNRSRLDIYAAARIAKAFNESVDALLGVEIEEVVHSPTTFLELESLVPRDYHQALSDCIELLTLDGHRAAEEARDQLGKQAKILLRDAKRQIEEDAHKEESGPTGALQPPPRAIRKMHPDPRKLIPRDPLRQDDQSEQESHGEHERRPNRKKT